MSQVEISLRFSLDGEPIDLRTLSYHEDEVVALVESFAQLAVWFQMQYNLDVGSGPEDGDDEIAEDVQFVISGESPYIYILISSSILNNPQALEWIQQSVEQQMREEIEKLPISVQFSYTFKRE